MKKTFFKVTVLKYHGFLIVMPILLKKTFPLIRLILLEKIFVRLHGFVNIYNFRFKLFKNLL